MWNKMTAPDLGGNGGRRRRARSNPRAQIAAADSLGRKEWIGNKLGKEKTEGISQQYFGRRLFDNNPDIATGPARLVIV
jgi:hypothetical protein